ncbi:hypothetical protein COCNU_14G011320 [Cocos nucifera]|uniref:Uncharacterized protein n=1 Tax=Cocos nucifera TaxID=13894 RepID=A0A8K0NCM9_COCNU|nr:hypothetical protein COCNU_14G011320 [Cocos nucifera]
MSSRRGPPKHQNRYAWKPNAGHKKNETKCGKRAVRQAYHNICSACAKDLNVCAKCCCRTDEIIGRDISEVETERKSLEEAIKNARERDRRSLLRANFGFNEKNECNKMNKEKAGKGASIPKIADRSREGELFAATSIDEYAELSRLHDSDEEEDEDFIRD